MQTTWHAVSNIAHLSQSICAHFNGGFHWLNKLKALIELQHHSLNLSSKQCLLACSTYCATATCYKLYTERTKLEMMKLLKDAM